MSDDDARLTDFLGETDEAADHDESDDAAAGAETAADPDQGEADADDAADAEPATSTAEWEPDGAACEDCGAVVERRWRDDGALVCLDCKAW